MAGRRWMIPVLIGLGLLVVAPSSAPAASPHPVAAQPGGAWATLSKEGRRGIVLLEWSDGGGTDVRLSAHATGLRPGGQVRLVVSRAGCADGLRRADRLISIRLTAGVKGIARGGIWRHATPITLAAGVADDIRSAWLVAVGGGFSVCGEAGVWDDTDIVHVVSGAYAVISAKGYRGIVVLGPADETGSELAYSLTVGPDVHGLRLVGTRTGCSTLPPPAARLFSLRLREPRPGVYFARSRTETVDKDETITIHGLWLRPTSGPTACEVPGIIAVLIGL